MYEHGFALTGFRQLTRVASVAFSFADNTPGAGYEYVCLHVRADRTVKPLGEGEMFVSLDEMLGESSGVADVAKLGIAQLINERVFLLGVRIGGALRQRGRGRHWT